MKSSEFNVVSKGDALIIGMKWYFTGISCKKGHIDKRYVNTGICYSCKRNNMKLDYNRNKDRHKKATKIYYENNKEKCKNRGQTWAERNREKSNIIKRNYKIRNREKYLKSERDRETRNRKNPLYRLDRAICKQIWAFLKGKKAGRKWESFVGYSFDDLKVHLESKFIGAMMWNNYGSVWEVDHIIPKSWFGKSEKELKKAWALSNLQPKFITPNRSKGNRYIG